MWRAFIKWGRMKTAENVTRNQIDLTPNAQLAWKRFLDIGFYLLSMNIQWLCFSARGLNDVWYTYIVCKLNKCSGIFLDQNNGNYIPLESHEPRALDPWPFGSEYINQTDSTDSRHCGALAVLGGTQQWCLVSAVCGERYPWARRSFHGAYTHRGHSAQCTVHRTRCTYCTLSRAAPHSGEFNSW